MDAFFHQSPSDVAAVGGSDLNWCNILITTSARRCCVVNLLKPSFQLRKI